jgi:hypothetical protein
MNHFYCRNSLKHLNDNFYEGRESIKRRKKKELKKEGRYEEKEKEGMYQRIRGREEVEFGVLIPASERREDVQCSVVRARSKAR